MKHRRRVWQRWQKLCDARRLLFIDETGLNTQMVRRYGRAQRGERCVDHCPHGHWKTSTFIAALRHDCVQAPWLLDGAMDAASFLVYVREVLALTLRPGDIVVCDNLSSHKGEEVVNAVRATGAQIRYLPPYSPDLNPIEMLFSKLKSFLRERAARTFEDLIPAMADALQSVSPSHCSNLFRHAQYATI